MATFQSNENNSIGIDSIRFHKSFDKATVEKRIKPHLKRIPGKEGQFWFYGFRAFQHKPIGFRFSFQISLGRLASTDDSNLWPAQPEDIERAIKKFETRTGLSVRDAEISRLDVAMNMWTEHEVSMYMPLIKEKNGYEVHSEEHGRYLNGEKGRRKLVLYDKREEMMRKKRFAEAMMYVDRNMMRAELQLLKAVKRQLGITNSMPALTLQSLTEPFGFIAAIMAYKKHVTEMLNLKEPSDVSEMTAQQVYNEALRALGRMYGDELGAMMETMMLEAGKEREELVDTMNVFDAKRLICLRDEVRDAVDDACSKLCAKYPLPKLNTFEATDVTGTLERSSERRMAARGYAGNISDRLYEAIMHEELSMDTEGAQKGGEGT
jgi:hypothetical protein